MRSFIPLLAIGLILLSTPFATPSAYAREGQGGKEGHGGDAVALEFKQLGTEMVENWRSNPASIPSGLNVREFQEALDSTPVESKTAILNSAGQILEGRILSLSDGYRLELNASYWTTIAGQKIARQALVFSFVSELIELRRNRDKGATS